MNKKIILESLMSTNKVHERVENILYFAVNEENLINFRNNELSYLTGALVYPDINKGLWFNRGIIRHYIGILKDLYIYRRRARKFLKKNNLKVFEFKDDLIGNPIIYKLANFCETGTNIYNNFLYSLIQPHLKNSKSILEVGAGFGKLCSLIVENHEINYNIIELAGTSIICNYYLNEKFRNTKINVNYIGDNLNSVQKVNGNINIIPSILLQKHNHKEKFNNIDTIINCQSFQHMDEKDINFYLKLIKDNKINKIISINRHSEKLEGETRFAEIFKKNSIKIESSLKIEIDFFGLENHYLSIFINN